MKPTSKLSVSARWLSIIMLLVLAVGGTWLVYHPEYLLRNNSIKTINQAQHNENKQSQVWVFYQPGCRDCRKVAVQLLIESWQLSHQTNTKVLQVNTQLAANQAVIRRFKITQTPTIIRLRGKRIERYQGTQVQRIKHIMRP